MPQFADFEQARAWLKRHPQVRSVDLLLPDLMGIPRGKRAGAPKRAPKPMIIMILGRFFALLEDGHPGPVV